MSDWIKKENKSTGPLTEEGKLIASKNALKHGCCATSTLILPTENEVDYKALEHIWCQAYDPKTDAERHLVAELINADWLLQRMTKAHADIEAQLYTQTPNPMDWTEAQERKLGRHLRYKTAQMNLMLKAKKSLEDYRKARRSEKTTTEKSTIPKEPPQPSQDKDHDKPQHTWEEYLEISKRPTQMRLTRR